MPLDCEWAHLSCTFLLTFVAHHGHCYFHLYCSCFLDSPCRYHGWWSLPPFGFWQGLYIHFWLELYMFVNHFVALRFRPLSFVLVILYFLGHSCPYFIPSFLPCASLYILLVHVLVSSWIFPTSSCCLLGSCLMLGVMADMMLIVHFCHLIVIDVLLSVIFHDALLASSCNAYLRHSLCSARSSNDPCLSRGIRGVVLFLPHWLIVR